jgi:hypothetical protein
MVGVALDVEGLDLGRFGADGAADLCVRVEP